MTAQPVGPAPGVELPQYAHRVAAARAARLAVHHGITEALAFYDTLTPREARLTFALLARATPPPALALDDDVTPLWTDDELLSAHHLWTLGRRAPWVLTGHRLFLRAQARARKAARHLADA